MDGYNTILVVAESLTKHCHLTALSALPSAELTAKILMKEVFKHHGIPDEVISDRGPQFTSAFWHALMDHLKIRRCLSTAYHPQKDGQTERANQTLEAYLRCYLADANEDWPDLLPIAEFALNNWKNKTTQFTPFFFNQGFNPRFTVTIPQSVTVPSALERVERIWEALEQAKVNIGKAKERYERNSNESRSEAPSLNPGTYACLSTKNFRENKSYPRFLGPLEIRQWVTPVSVELVLPRCMRIHLIFRGSLIEPVIENSLSNRTNRIRPP